MRWRSREDGRRDPLGAKWADLADVLIAADLAHPVETVSLDDSVLTAICRMGVRGLPSLPVVEEEGVRHRGTIDRRDILAAYETAAAGAEGRRTGPPSRTRRRSGTRSSTAG